MPPFPSNSIKETGPADGKLMPGDQILEINGHDVRQASQDEVIDLVK